MEKALYDSIERYIGEHFIHPCRYMRHELIVCEEHDIPGIEDAISMAEESFSERLFSLIKEKGISEVECYKKAGITRQVFSKIRSNKGYNPSRNTAISLAISLHLTLNETNALLETAGFTLSRSSKADLIIEYFIINRKWELREINEALYSFGENPINV